MENQEQPHKIDLTVKILIAMVMGLVVGWGIFEFLEASTVGDSSQNNLATWIDEYVVGGLFFVGGKLFIASLKMMVVPLVFVSLVCGVCATDSGKDLGRLGGKSFGLYFLTTAVAITLALFVAQMVDPGAGAELGETATYAPKERPTLVQVIVDIVPKNPVQAMANANMLQIMVFAILVGLGIHQAGESGARIASLFRDLNDVVLKMVTLVMHLAPAGVFCLVAGVFAEKGVDFIFSLASYFFTVVFVLLLHGVGTFTVLLTMLARVNPIIFYKKMWPAAVFGFSTASSAATMPVTLRLVEKALGVRNSVSSFTIPMGTTINMDGTAIMQGVATVFIANAYGIDLGLTEYLTVILTATMASVGTAAVPGAGMITLAMVLLQVGLPAEAIGLIIGVDRLLDMMRTAVNIIGDATVTCVVAQSENKLEMAVFNDLEERGQV
ncbi:MAG: dicarboxylate/amino acid:cation symporter [Pseudomonadales bacterium]|nr:dicarboxylate/amino acid:cation symporter [Pseudomonadales bacterium]